jgi:hypothetical protein
MRSTERSKGYYKTPGGKLKKKIQNGKRGKHGPKPGSMKELEEKASAAIAEEEMVQGGECELKTKTQTASKVSMAQSRI